ncbi:ribosomal biogenesis factor [Mugil cephalus]|uniref:ribosomal biogenesis factor n=1 Tax=Mugil cephalus TaxID=48193 RepID=UPI001FB7D39E|nr:ribosomal biogenesis factor [Mugil cephalus]
MTSEKERHVWNSTRGHQQRFTNKPCNMAKNKQKGKKQKNVFQVANKHLKSKNKAKAVTTTLKHINGGKKEKVESLNQIFTEVQRDVKSISKSVAPEPKKQTQVVREPPKESVNVDNAAQLFSQL